MKRYLWAVALTLTICSINVFGQRTTTSTKIISQPSAPIKIITYNAVYIGSGSTYVSRGIHHSLEYEDIGASSSYGCSVWTGRV